MAEPRLTNPYPGPRPFVTGEKLYGRDREVTKLFYLLSAERIVVLHSPSGAGKSSLLNAGLVPRLRAERFDVWPTIRLSQPAADGGNRFVRSTVSSLEEGLPERRRRPSDEIAGMSLAEYLAGRPRRPGAPASVVLVFDQFEEILTIDPLGVEPRREFFRQLGGALENPEVWALFALREDYLGAFDPYRDDVPTRLSNTFRVDLLTVDAATDAIARPAKDAGREFDAGAARELANDLATVSVQQPDGSFAEETGLYVEPLQLQVVCRRLWDGLPAETRTIGAENLLQSGDVDAALASYYDSSVAEIAGTDVAAERGLREWFGDRLITPGGIRGQVLREQTASGGLDNDSVDRLVATHLVRSEQRDGKTWFELAHDRLVSPVRESNAAWLEHHLHPMQRQAALWEREGRPDSLLLRGEELRDALIWAVGKKAFARPVEVELLNASVARLRAQQRRRRGLAALVVVFAALTVLAVVSWRQAVASEDSANNAAEKANSLLFAAPAQARAKTDLRAALLLALEANHFAETAAARNAMTLALGRARSTGLEGIIGVPSPDAVTSVAFSPDGKTLASGGKGLRLWDLASRKPGPALPDNVGPPLGNSQEVDPFVSIVFSPDGTKLAALWGDGTLRLWELRHGKPLERDLVEPPYGNQATLSSVAFSADGNTLASGAETGNVTLWDLRAARPTGIPLRDTRGVTSLAFSPRGKTLALVGPNGTVQLRDLASPASPARALPGARDVRVVAFSPDGKTLATGPEVGDVRLWNLAAPSLHGTPLAPLPDRGAAVSSLVFSGDEKTLAVGEDAGNVRLWDRVARSWLVTSITGSSAAFSPDGKTLATGGDDGTVRLWDPASGQPFPTAGGNVGSASAVAFSPDDKTLAVGAKGGSVQLWDLASRHPVGKPLAGGGKIAVLAIAFSRDGKTLATADANGTVRLWDLPSATLRDTPVAGVGRQVTSVAFSPDGRTLATGSSDGKVEVWDVGSGKLLATPVDYSGDEGGSISTVVFSPDGKVLASGGQFLDPTHGAQAGAVRIWPLGSRKPAGPAATVVSPLTESGPGPDRNVVSVAFSPDGKTLATGENTDVNGTVRLRDLSSRTLAGPTLLGGDSSTVSGIAFAPDGQRLAVSYADAKLQLWDLASRNPLGDPLKGDSGPFADLVFSPDGRSLAGVGPGAHFLGTVVGLWQPASWTDYNDLQDQVCRLVWSNLSQDEWRDDAPTDFPYRAVCPT